MNLMIGKLLNLLNCAFHAGIEKKKRIYRLNLNGIFIHKPENRNKVPAVLYRIGVA